jgi:ABC-type nitrate/sulfonate/bicarbonate transport system permease component
MEAAVVAFACIWPILLVTTAAVQGIEPRLLEVARALELSYGAALRKIVFPAALGRIVVGVRLAVGIALIVAVTVEIVLNPRGLGYAMIGAQQSFHADLMYAELIWLGILGWLLNAGLSHAVRRWTLS